MGFQPEPTHYRLKFAKPELRGLEVTAESLSTDEFLRVSELASTATKTQGAEAAESARHLLDAFAANLVSWNIEDRHGNLVAPSREEIGRLKFDFVLGIVMAWMEAIASVDSPLPEGSPSGATLAEVSLPMEPLSANHRSSLVPS
jgi:hypothetical protein